MSVYPAWFYFLNMLQAVNQLGPSAWGDFGPLCPKTGTACLSSTPDASITPYRRETCLDDRCLSVASGELCWAERLARPAQQWDPSPPTSGKPGQLVPIKAGCRERALPSAGRVTGTHWDDAFSM